MIQTSKPDKLEKEVQNYIDLIYSTEFKNSAYVTKERINKNIDKYAELLNQLMVYPDVFIDMVTPRNSKFSLFFEQRMVLRAMIRYRQSYFTFTRAFSKSFLAFLSRYLTCMFIPRHHGFVVAGSKKQAAQIAKEKVIDDLWVKFPFLANEMQKFRRANKLKVPFKESGDTVEFYFPNGSIFDVVGGKMRGGRRNSGIFEEVIDQDPDYINETIIPLLNTIRRDRQGRVNPAEPQGQKIYVTTAGYQGTFAYDKLVETMCLSILQPEKYIVMGGSYKIPVMHGLLSEDTMREILSSPSYRGDQVDREYRSIWSGSIAGAAFEAGEIAKCRVKKRAEYRCADEVADGNTTDFYVISCDIAKDGGANTAVIVGRVSIGEYMFGYKFVNLFTIDSPDYEVVANTLKQTAAQYNARMLIYDANGVGASMREWLNKETRSKDGYPLQGLGIINPPSTAEDSVIKYKDKTRNICYEIKTGGQKASEVHRTFFSKVSTGSVRFLIRSADALAMYEKNDNFMRASKAKKDRIMRPYYYTDQMETEMKNLDIQDTGDRVNNTIIIERRNKNIQKDFFSAAEYLVYGVQQYLELPFYFDKAKKANRKVVLKVSGNMNSGGGRKDLGSRRSGRQSRR